MAEYTKGVVLIDLENNSGWGDTLLPASISVLRPFDLPGPTTAGQIGDALARHLEAEVKPFIIEVAPEKPREENEYMIPGRELLSAALMGLHLDIWKVVRSISPTSVKLDQAGDNYVPTVHRRGLRAFRKNRFEVQNVSFAYAHGQTGEEDVIWESEHVRMFEFRRGDDQNAS